MDPREGPDSVTDPRRFRAALFQSRARRKRFRVRSRTRVPVYRVRAPGPFIITRIRACGNVRIARRSIVPGAPSLFFINRIRACGNVGIVRRFPRAVGRVGNPVSGFPRFPRPVISIGSGSGKSPQERRKTRFPANHGELSISPLDHRRYAVTRGACAKNRLLMFVSPLFATHPP